MTIHPSRSWLLLTNTKQNIMPLISVSILLPSHSLYFLFLSFQFSFSYFFFTSYFSLNTSFLSFVFPSFIFLYFPHTLTLSLFSYSPAFYCPFSFATFTNRLVVPHLSFFPYYPLHFILSYLPSLSFLSSFLYFFFSRFASLLLAFCFLLNLSLVFHVNYSSIYFHILLLSIRIPF